MFTYLLLGVNVFVMVVLGPLSLLIILQDFLQQARWYRRLLTTCGCKAMIYVVTEDEDEEAEEDDDEDKSDDSDDEYTGEPKGGVHGKAHKNFSVKR